MTPEEKSRLLPFQLGHAMGKNSERTKEAEELGRRFYKEAHLPVPIENK